MDAKIKELLTRLSFFAEDGMADKPIVEIAKQADALLLEVARKPNTQQPVAYMVVQPGCKAGKTFLSESAAYAELLESPAGSELVNLYATPPVPRDVLMAALGACRAECAKHYLGDADDSQIDLAAIADRYASKVQPELVNKQLLASLKRVTEEIQDLMSESEGVAGFHRNGDIATWGELEAGGRFERLSGLPDALAAIAEAAQPVWQQSGVSK